MGQNNEQTNYTIVLMFKFPFIRNTVL